MSYTGTDRAYRVLIVEDNPMVGEMIQGILNRLGYAVVGLAQDGQRALDRMAELVDTLDQPDVVLMDVEMPGMDGIEASRRIQQRFPTPVVMLTAYDQPELIAQAGQAGAGAYLIKPPNLSELERAIVIAIARFEDMQTLRRVNARLGDEIAERARAQQALEATHHALRERHHQQRVLARAVSQFNAAASTEEVLDALVRALCNLGYAHAALWVREGERLRWQRAPHAALPWWDAAVHRLTRGQRELDLAAPLDGENVYARCYADQAACVIAQGSDLVAGLQVSGLPLDYLPAAVEAFSEQPPTLRYSAFPLGEYGVLVLAGPDDDRARRPWAQVVVVQAATAIERQQLIVRLREALAEVRALSGLLPICAHCKKIRDDQGYWHQVEEYIQNHSDAEFSHGLCPECARLYYGEYMEADRE